MTRTILLLCLMLAACAASEGPWPSLARRPGEVGTTSAQPAEPASASAPASPPVASATGDIAAADARLAQTAVDLEMTTARWQQQRGETERAVAQARGTAHSGPAWARGQLELSRLDKLGAQFSDLRARLDAVAGDLAVMAAGGMDVSASLRRTGELVARVSALQADHDRAFAAANADLQR